MSLAISVALGLTPVLLIGAICVWATRPRVSSRVSRALPRTRTAPAARLAYRSNIRARSSFAPSLDRGSLRLPHLGDCTQEGQPSLQRHSAIKR
jgi:hypothetical protein